MKKIDITYASKAEHNFAQRLIIKTIERATGKKKLEKVYKEYSEKNNDPRFFWSWGTSFFDLQLNSTLVFLAVKSNISSA